MRSLGPAPSVASDIATKEYVDGVQRSATFNPADIGLIACNFDPALAVTTSSVLNSNGVLYLQRVWVPATASATGMVIALTTAGATLTSGQNFAALYDSSANLVSGTQTADQSTAWTSTGVKQMTFAGGARSLSAGYYWVAVWANGTTRPALVRGNSAVVVNGILPAASARFATSNNSVTTTAPATLGARTLANTAYWVGIY